MACLVHPGDYHLVAYEGRIYRDVVGEHPEYRITMVGGRGVHEPDGLLRPEFWALPRLRDEFTCRRMR